MTRHDFIKQSSVASLLLSIKPFELLFANEKPVWLLEWIKIQDQSLQNYEPLRIIDPKHQYYGGCNDDADIPSPQVTSNFIFRHAMLVSLPESAHYQSDKLFKIIENAAKSMLKMQHQDGTIDLLSTNFHSPPDTAFVLENLIPAYSFLQNVKEAEVGRELLKTFLKKAGNALIVGGIHTPNHRWVVAAALTKLYLIFADKRYLHRINQWLAEHIDMDSDGQYTEKSTHTYSPIVNEALIAMADGLKKPELLAYVRKNLLMTLYYIHPNGEVVTEGSNRQDKGIVATMLRYYYCYKYMALHDNDGQMAAVCRLIEQTHTTAQLSGYLNRFLENPALWKNLPDNKTLPTSYEKAFMHSGIVRIRREHWDTTLLTKNASWLTFHNGKAVLQAMRVATSFFGKGQFDSANLVKIGNAWVFRKTLTGPYYQPVVGKQIAKDGNWDKMPRQNRKQSEVQKLTYEIKITEIPNGIAIETNITGTDNVPVTMELIFRAGGVFGGVEKYAKRENVYLFASEKGTYSVGNDSIQFSGGKIAHKGLQLRGALPTVDAPTVYITGFTPFNHRLTLEASIAK